MIKVGDKVRLRGHESLKTRTGLVVTEVKQARDEWEKHYWRITAERGAGYYVSGPMETFEVEE